MNEISRIKELKKLLKQWGHEYYDLDQPTVSDAQYDGAIIELKNLETNNPNLITPDSPTQTVGGTVLDKFVKVKHEFPMLSLSNAFNHEDLRKFDEQIKKILHSQQDIKYTCELKIDGVSISLLYKDGKLDKAITRGNGVTGEDVTHNVKTIRSIPQNIMYKKDLEIRGEIYMSDKVFEKLNYQGENFANPRNAASGTLRQLDSSVAQKRQLDAFLYMIPNPLDHNLISHKETLDFIQSQGLPTNKETRLVTSIQGAIDFVEQYKSAKLGYEYDGIVIKVDDNNIHEEIGYTAKAPKYMIAYKFPEEVASTELIDIFSTIGRTGRVTYNAKLSPVRLSGTVVSAATLHNADYVAGLGLSIGDIVKVKKAGEIIPKVIGIDKKKGINLWRKDIDCPICRNKLSRTEGEVDQYCINEACPAILKASIQHYVSREAMDIEGFGNKIVERLINEGFVKSIIDIYKLDKNNLIALEGFQEKSVKKLLFAIEKSKTQELNRFIFGLGIRHVGAKYAKILAKRFGTLQAIIEAKSDKLNSIREIGPKVMSSILEYLEENSWLIQGLKDVGVSPTELEGAVSNILIGKTFAVTGTLSETRKYFTDIIEINGGNVSSTISSKTDYLLAGKSSGSKLDRANSLNVQVINESEFKNMIGGANE